jgi:threonine/homoserine/homoserine lactone efflux protein
MKPIVRGEMVFSPGPDTFVAKKKGVRQDWVYGVV